ncbi:hypothetical protein FOA52_011895 [Chlamydomonas sp. UWO 241]|nr:hypothetical protein FOA52_011895 [Chlamydomonas sp. UWO 241]
MIPTDLDQMLRALNHKDLRIQTRARGLSPAGSQEALRDRLKEAMIETKDFSLKNEDGSDATTVAVVAGGIAPSELKNNYSRPEGQNVGNYMTDRNSSRVLAPPGGKSQIAFGDNNMPENGNKHGNNYSRPEGQNVGNFLGDRNSSRVLAPPGGASQITFG